MLRPPVFAAGILTLLLAGSQEAFTSQLVHPQSVTVYVEGLATVPKMPVASVYTREQKPRNLYRLTPDGYGWTWPDHVTGTIVKPMSFHIEGMEGTFGSNIVADALSKGILFRLPSKKIPKAARLEIHFRAEYGGKLSITGVIAEARIIGSGNDVTAINSFTVSNSGTRLTVPYPLWEMGHDSQVPESDVIHHEFIPTAIALTQWEEGNNLNTWLSQNSFRVYDYQSREKFTVKLDWPEYRIHPQKGVSAVRLFAHPLKPVHLLYEIDLDGKPTDAQIQDLKKLLSRALKA